MAAIQKFDLSVRFEIFTRVPWWFFRNSLSGSFAYHFLLTDIGLVQKTPLCEDFDRTVQCLNTFLPFDDSHISDLARRVNRLKCKLIICDIAPMGIAVARQAEIPSVTMGGVSALSSPHSQSPVGKWKKLTDKRAVHFIIPGGAQSVEIHDNLVFLPHNSDFFHPDIINACDAVIGKVGYSTLAEIFHAGITFGYISRPSFPESENLAEFIKREMTGFPIEESEFQNYRWLSRLEDLLSFPRIRRDCPDGAEQAAHFIYKLL